MCAGLEDESFIYALTAKFEIILLGRAVFHDFVPIIRHGRYIMDVWSSQIDKVDFIRTFRLRMHEQVVFHRLASIYHDVRHSECGHVKVAGSGICKAQGAALVDRHDELLVRVGRYQYCAEHEFVVSIDHEVIIVHVPALSDIAGCEADVVELVAYVEDGTCREVVVPERRGLIEDDALVEFCASHREGQVVGCTVVYLFLDLSDNGIWWDVGDQLADIRQSLQTRIRRDEAVFCLRDADILTFRVHFDISDFSV